MKKGIQKVVPIMMEMAILLLNEVKLRFKYRNRN